MINRSRFFQAIQKTLEALPACGLVGPRQAGKSTLARQYAAQVGQAIHFFDLEDPLHLEQLNNPKLALEPLKGLTIIDEIQLRPNLFSYLRVLIDQQPDRRFLLLGSASPELICQSAESLAGRIGYVELTPFSFQECSDEATLWHRGGFPRSYLAGSDEQSLLWRKAYIKTFLERDLLALGFNFSPHTMRKLWMMLAHYHGNILNYSELGRSLGITDKTVQRFAQMLEGAFMIRILPAWYANISKRQVKAPKVYLRDSGLLHALLQIESYPPIHPKTGASWEGFSLEEVIRFHQADREDCYFWSTQHQAELDLLIFKGSTRLAFEFKYTDHPRMTRSLHSALEDLELDLITVIIPGNADFYIHERVRVQGLQSYILTEPAT